MRRSTFLGAATAAALAAGSLAVTMAPGSSHREAPKILADPTADNTDVYAFTAPDAPGAITIVANWIPFEEPAGGPYFGKPDPDARYDVYKETYRNRKLQSVKRIAADYPVAPDNVGPKTMPNYERVFSGGIRSL